MRSLTSLGICIVALLCAAPMVAAQTRDATRDLVLEERRLAVVIGNNAYARAPLENAVSDARAISGALRNLGFEVTLVEDADRATMVRSIATIGDTVTPKDVVFFFFAGHGIQIGGENYLIPTDFGARSGASVRLEALASTDVQQALNRAKVSLLVLDACRNNPFGSERGSVGLAPMEARGSMVAYATAAGQTASDNPGASNGLFTQELLKALREPNISARNLFYRVRQQVYEVSGGRQFPAVYDGLLGDAELGRAGVQADVVATPPLPVSAPNPSTAPATVTTQPTATPETVLWTVVAKMDRLTDYELYLAQYPSGAFADAARNRIADLKREGNRARPNIIIPLPGTEWTGTYQYDTENGVKADSTITLHFAENGRGKAVHIFWNSLRTDNFKWEQLGTQIVIKIDGPGTGNNHALRGKIEGDTMGGSWSSQFNPNSTWRVKLVPPGGQ